MKVTINHWKNSYLAWNPKKYAYLIPSQTQNYLKQKKPVPSMMILTTK